MSFERSRDGILGEFRDPHAGTGPTIRFSEIFLGAQYAASASPVVLLGATFSGLPDPAQRVTGLRRLGTGRVEGRAPEAHAITARNSMMGEREIEERDVAIPMRAAARLRRNVQNPIS